MPESIGSPFLWFSFTLFILAMLALDLGVFHRHAHAIRPREAATWTAIWVALALCFNGWIALRFGRQLALEFLTGYLIEKSLSVDNIFVFMVIFSYFAVPSALQHRVLFWGIVGALILRALFIVSGAALLEAFHWIIFVFGGFLILTGLRILTQRAGDVHPERNPVARLFRRFVPLVPRYEGTRFTVIWEGRRHATLLLLVLLVVETTDVLFAVDSIPAIFAVTRDPFIVYTSNIFAILGLRALYFLVVGAIGSFRYLKIGLGAVLVFVGIKMLVSDAVTIPIGVSLMVVAGLIAGSIAASLVGSSPPPASPASDPDRVSRGDHPSSPT